jgi:hypothetical protein
VFGTRKPEERTAKATESMAAELPKIKRGIDKLEAAKFAF